MQKQKILLFLRQTHLFIKAYPRTIIIGECADYSVCEETAFIIDLCNLQSLYLNIVEILNCFRKNAMNKKTVFAINKENTYSWEKTSEDCINLFNSREDKNILSLTLNYKQTNELLYGISEAIIPCLCLENYEEEFVHFILNADIVDLVKATNYDLFNKILEDTPFKTDSSKLFGLFKFYLDIIFILLKLKKFCNNLLLPNNLEPLLKI